MPSHVYSLFVVCSEPFSNNILKARDEELRYVQRMGMNRAIMMSLVGNTTTLIIGNKRPTILCLEFLTFSLIVVVLFTAVTFLFYGLFGPNTLTPQVAFSTLSVVNLLRLPFTILPLTLNLVQSYRVTFQR